MKMFRMLAASMLSAALCLGFTACSDDDENENGEGGGSTVTRGQGRRRFTEDYRSRLPGCLSPKTKKDW